MNDVHAKPSRGLIVAAPRSGSGKTTLTLGLLTALTEAGYSVSALKCGPDYIDPAFHEVATGRPSRNIDTWAMRPELFDGVVSMARKGADLVVCEALMGVFDGVQTSGPLGNGSSADAAARTGWPLLLVLDVSGQAQTAAATALGFAKYRSDVNVAGVILNRVASDRHRTLASSAIEAVGLPVLGALPKHTDIVLPERHLGLVQAQEVDGLRALLRRLGDWVAEHVDLGRIADVAETGRRLDTTTAAITPPGQRIALAQDTAFSFLYPHLRDAWRKAGAELLPFSPLADEVPDASADVCWLPGGYPELHTAKLSAASTFMAGLRAFSETRPVHGECGGYMVLGKALVDKFGDSHEMAGILGHSTSFAKRKMNLGYRRAMLACDTPFAAAGTRLNGHEFHYSTMIERGDDAALARLTDANGRDLGDAGGRRGHVTGAYFHIIDYA